MTEISQLPTWSFLSGQANRVAELSVAVVYGGRSSEREVSLRSGEAVLAALGRSDAPALGSLTGVEVLPDGRWRVGEHSLTPARALELLPSDAVFLIALHGGEGEGGVLQGFLEISGRVHTGAGVAASALCLDKVRARHVCAAFGLTVAPGHSFRTDEWKSDPERHWKAVEALGSGPWFLKPSLGGSSVSMSVAHDRAGFFAACDALPALQPGEALLVEQAIRGVEVTQGLVGPVGDAVDPVPLPLVEICPKGAGWFDFHEKYSDDGAQEFCPPRNLAPERQAQVARAAQRAWHALGLTSYARLDFLV
ncbi:MAG TPA: hypothetical protein PLJ12_10640, partial [Planctomycetota bacterium]|nr:hypothetical protein [Planctomycetota bacterium]